MQIAMMREHKFALIISLFLTFAVFIDLGVSIAYYMYGDTDYFIDNEQNRYVVESLEKGEFPIMFFAKLPLYLLSLLAGTWGFIHLKVKLENYIKLLKVTNFAYGIFIFSFIFLGIANLVAGFTWYDGNTNLMGFIYSAAHYNFLLFLVLSGFILIMIVIKSFIIYYKERKQVKQKEIIS